ncbi:MAG: LytTR family transcriptional regulator [Bacteroidaceae bacterium]|nr:LytTR family transcriptional regulator [Bacteroidaceae bacterium]
MGILGFIICLISESIVRHILKMPVSFDKGVGYIIKRNLRFQLINTPFVTLAICLYRHLVLNNDIASNKLTFLNYIDSLIIISFCSFVIGLYWRFKLRSKFMAVELEEMRSLNEHLQELQKTNYHLDDKNNDTEEIELHTDKNNTKDTEKGATTNNASKSHIITLTGTTSDKLTLNINNLIYIETVGNYVKVYHLKEGNVYSDMIRATSKQMEERLQDYSHIIRCHRAFLINLRHVEQITSKAGNTQVLMSHCNEYIPVSRSNLNDVKEAIRDIK